MKIEWSTVFEISIGVLIAGLLLVAINGLFGKWLQAQGAKIHGEV